MINNYITSNTDEIDTKGWTKWKKGDNGYQTLYKEYSKIVEKDEKKNLEEKVIKLKTSIDYFDEFIKSEVPNRMILQMLIDKIYINKNKTIIFKLKGYINKML